jgi:phospholipid transport system substrate-binding protein
MGSGRARRPAPPLESVYNYEVNLMYRFIKAITKGAVLFLLVCTISSQAWGSAAMDQLRSTVDEVIKVLANPNLKKPGQDKQRRNMLKQVINQRFSYEEMAKQSLGQYWNTLGAQRTEFVQLFSELLERSYANKLEAYSDEKVIYQSERPDGDYTEIKTVIKRPNDQISVNYRMIDKGSKWWVYDVVIEGVSLVSNYRNQFGRIIRESSIQGLLQRMRNKLQEQKNLENL